MTLRYPFLQCDRESGVGAGAGEVLRNPEYAGGVASDALRNGWTGRRGDSGRIVPVVPARNASGGAGGGRELTLYVPGTFQLRSPLSKGDSGREAVAWFTGEDTHP